MIFAFREVCRSLIVVLLSALCFGNAAAQVGMTKAEFQTAFPTALANERLTDECAKALELTVLTAKLGNRPHRVVGGFRDDRACFIHFVDSSKSADKDDLTFDDMKAFLEQHNRKSGQKTKWALDSRSVVIFPPLGVTKGQWSEVTRTTGLMVKTLTIDAYTGKLLWETPWHELRVPTGELRYNSGMETYLKHVLRNKDGSVYATVAVSGTTSFRGGMIERIGTMAIHDADIFWKQTILAASESSPGLEGDYYETRFSYDVPQTFQERARLRRVLAAVFAAIETSTIPVDEVVSCYRVASKKIPQLNAAFEEDVFKLRQPTFASGMPRLMEFAGEVGEPSMAHGVISKMRQSPAVRQHALAALKRLANRHGLVGLPAEHSIDAEFTKWAQSVVPLAKQ